SDVLGAPGERPSVRKTSAYDPPEAATGAISTAADVWQLGMTLIEVLTRRLPVWDRARPSAPEVPAAVPEPLREIAEHCLQVDARTRWTVVEIGDALEGKGQRPAPSQSERAVSAPAISGQHKVSAKWPYLLGLAAVVAVAFFFIARPKPSGTPREGPSTQTPQGAAGEGSPSARVATQTAPKASPARPGEARAGDEEPSEDTETAATDN